MSLLYTACAVWRPLGACWILLLSLIACVRAPEVPDGSDAPITELRMLVENLIRDETFVVRPDGSDPQPVALDPMWRGWEVSRAGTHVVQWNDRSIWAASTDDFAFARIATRSHHDERINHVTWTPDGQQLVYVTHRGIGDPEDNFESTMRVMSSDGLEPRLVRSWVMFPLVSLIAADDERAYWFENSGHGNARLGLFVTTLETGETERIMPNAGAIAAFSFQLSADFRMLYFTTENSGPLVEYDLVSKTRRVLDESGGRDLLLAPEGNTLYYTRFPSEHARATTYRMLLPSGETSVIYETEDEDAIGPRSISPDGRYLVFEDFLMDTQTLTMSDSVDGKLLAWVRIPASPE